ncbi:hypothetical protein [Anaeromyxobacter paludicola]|uniref:hypothetical protein n=1 Tax=Anaeromyxobacter paludicola TaxID=2918171 RepID=UPI0020BDAC53|nr:hypothetical protein [Anaeromyxobacter paludicola]
MRSKRLEEEWKASLARGIECLERVKATRQDLVSQGAEQNLLERFDRLMGAWGRAYIAHLDDERAKLARSATLARGKEKASARRRSRFEAEVLAAARSGRKVESIAAEHSERRELARKAALTRGGDERAARVAAAEAGWSRAQVHRVVQAAREDGRLPRKLGARSPKLKSRHVRR